MTRESIERDTRFSPLGKLILEWLSRRPAGVHAARDIATALGVMTSMVSEEAHSLRRLGLLLKEHDKRSLALAELALNPKIREVYQPATTEKRTKAA